MDNIIFAKSTGCIRALENKLLTRSKINDLVGAVDFSDCIRLLQDTIYGEYVLNPSYEEGLKMALQDLYREMYKITPVESVLDILSVRIDAHNIKCLIKGSLTGMDIDRMLIDAGEIPVSNLKIIMNNNDLKGLPAVLAKAVTNAKEEYKKSQNPQDIDLVLDAGMYSYMLEVAEGSQIEFLKDFVKFLIDTTNIKIFIRVKAQGKGIGLLGKALISGGILNREEIASFANNSLEKFADKILYTRYDKWKTVIDNYIENGNISAIEKFGDDSIIDYLKKAKYVGIGPEPLIAYTLVRENEIKIVRTILTGKKNKVLPAAIRERLRDVYV